MRNSAVLIMALTVAAALLAPLNASADTEGPYTYTVADGKATITGFNEYYSGALSITNQLGGYPVTAIGERAFYWCTSLTSVTIPDSVTTIGSLAFSGTSITSVTIPGSVTSIGSFAFSGTSITSVTIPGSVTSIGTSAFYYCTSLTSVTIPDSVTSIGIGAFYSCTSLTSVYFCGVPPPTLESSVFSTTLSTLYYLPAHAAAWEALPTFPTYADRPTLCWNPVVGNMTAPSSTTPFSFAITGTTNIPVAVEACTALSAGTWNRLLTTNIPPTGVLEFTDPADSSSNPSRFYRVVAP